MQLVLLFEYDAFACLYHAEKYELTIANMATIREPAAKRYSRDLKTGAAQESVSHFGEVIGDVGRHGRRLSGMSMVRQVNAKAGIVERGMVFSGDVRDQSRRIIV